MVREGLRPPLLIFVQSIERAMQLFHALVYDGLRECAWACCTAARGRRPTVCTERKWITGVRRRERENFITEQAALPIGGTP